VRNEQHLLWGAVALVVFFQSPLLFGRGIDIPDDYILYGVSSWEWWRSAIHSGVNPFFVTGKLGGVSLFGDAVAMGPIYPAIWLSVVLPVHLAFPLGILLHTLGAFVGTRWLATTVGASPLAATLAGAAIALGPMGTYCVVDGRVSAGVSMTWLPFVLGCAEMAASQEAPRARRFTLLGGFALALALLGGHIRHATVVAVMVGLWVLIRRVPFRRAAALLGLGLAGGAPGYIPVLREWGQVASSKSRWAMLSAPAETDFEWSNLPGFLVPRVSIYETDYGWGVVLLVGLLFALPRVRGAAGRLLLLAGVGFFAAAAAGVPGGRWLMSPLLLLTHPINDVWFGFALFPAAAAAAVGLDRLASLPAVDRWAVCRKLGALLGVLWILAVLLAIFGGAEHGLERLASRRLHAAGLVQAALALLFLGFLLRSKRVGAALLTPLLLLGLLDLGATALRIHLVAPSMPLQLSERGVVENPGDFANGYLDIQDIIEVDGFAYGEPAEQDEDFAVESPVWEREAARVQQVLRSRGYGYHLGMRLGVRSVGGNAKMPPIGLVHLLLPAKQLLLTRVGPEILIQSPDSVFRRVAGLHGVDLVLVPTVPDDPRRAQRVRLGPHEVLPRCRLVSEVELVRDPTARRDLLLGRPLVPGRGIVEEALPASAELSQGTLHCSAGEASVSSDGTTLLVVAERVHPGWRFENEEGEDLATFPVDEIHTGVLLPAGEHRVSWTFVPPGLLPSMVVSGMAWIWGLLLLVFGPRILSSRNRSSQVEESLR